MIFNDRAEDQKFLEILDNFVKLLAAQEILRSKVVPSMNIPADEAMKTLATIVTKEKK